MCRGLRARCEGGGGLEKTSYETSNRTKTSGFSRTIKEPPLVRASNATQQCARPGVGRLQIAQPAPYCAITEALRRIEQAARRHAVSVRDVDAEFLHQPRREKSSSRAEAGVATSQRRTAFGVWQGMSI